jgi:hypothetical protein
MPPTQVLKSTAATRASHIRVRLRIIPVLAISYTCSTYQSPPRNYPDLVTRITSVFVADNLWSTSNSCDPMSCVNPPRNTHNPSEEDNSVIMDLELYLMITYTVTSFMWAPLISSCELNATATVMDIYEIIRPESYLHPCTCNMPLRLGFLVLSHEKQSSRCRTQLHRSPAKWIMSSMRQPTLCTSSSRHHNLQQNGTHQIGSNWPAIQSPKKSFLSANC